MHYMYACHGEKRLPIPCTICMHAMVRSTYPYHALYVCMPCTCCAEAMISSIAMHTQEKLPLLLPLHIHAYAQGIMRGTWYRFDAASHPLAVPAWPFMAALLRPPSTTSLPTHGAVVLLWLPSALAHRTQSHSQLVVVYACTTSSLCAHNNLSRGPYDNNITQSINYHPTNNQADAPRQCEQLH